ncbi:MAG: FAD-dependent monooxygenase [Pacificimonas sp.]
MPNLVIGGGPAGAVLAAKLAARREAVTLLERSDGPHHKICGEFLSWEGRALLRRAGIDIESLGGASISRLRIVAKARTAETKLPGEALGISRYRLDERLLEEARRRGVDVRRGRDVRRWSEGIAHLADDGAFTGERTWLATGKRDLRGAARDLAGERISNDLTGFKLHLRLADADARAIANTIELHHFDGGYAGLQPIEDGLANLCLLAERDLASGGWDAVRAHLGRAAPQLASQLDRAEPQMDTPLAIARVPYGFVSRTNDGPIRIGDQLAVIHSFTGDGLSLAIASGMAAAEGREPREMVAKPVGRAALAYRLLAGGGWPLDAVLAVPRLASHAARWTRVRYPERL